MASNLLSVPANERKREDRDSRIAYIAGKSSFTKHPKVGHAEEETGAWDLSGQLHAGWTRLCGELATENKLFSGEHPFPGEAKS